MARNEQTSKKASTIAGKALPTGKAMPKQIKALAASALTQSPPKKTKRS